MGEFLAGVNHQLGGDIHVLRPFHDLAIGHIGDDGLIFPRQVFIQAAINCLRVTSEVFATSSLPFQFVCPKKNAAPAPLARSLACGQFDQVHPRIANKRNKTEIGTASSHKYHQSHLTASRVRWSLQAFPWFTVWVGLGRTSVKDAGR